MKCNGLLGIIRVLILKSILFYLKFRNQKQENYFEQVHITAFSLYVIIIVPPPGFFGIFVTESHVTFITLRTFLKM